MGKIIILIIFLFISCSREQDKIIRNFSGGEALGTSYHITYLAKEELNFQKEIDSVFMAINQSMSTYLPTSDISRINEGDTTVVVDTMFLEVFQLSKEIHKVTNGYFDPTVGTLVNAWGFGPGRVLEMDSTIMDSLLNFVGLDKIMVEADNRIKKEKPEIQLDFNAIAKGYAVDRLAVLLDHKGIEDYLIEVGGEVIAKGSNRIKEKPWVVGVDDPQAEQDRSIKLAIQIKDRALASSGNYRKFRLDSVTGQKYVHTIDPKTGFTKNSNILAVTVLAASCAKADAYATAFMAMELNDSQSLITRRKDLDAYIIYLDEEGTSKEFMTPGFEALVVK